VPERLEFGRRTGIGRDSCTARVHLLPQFRSSCPHSRLFGPLKLPFPAVTSSRTRFAAIAVGLELERAVRAHRACLKDFSWRRRRFDSRRRATDPVRRRLRFHHPQRLAAASRPRRASTGSSSWPFSRTASRALRRLMDAFAPPSPAAEPTSVLTDFMRRARNSDSRRDARRAARHPEGASLSSRARAR